MDFKKAADRIGFPLAVVLYEDELPENLWQTATVEECFSALHRRKERHSYSNELVGQVQRQLSELLLAADYKTACSMHVSYRNLGKDYQAQTIASYQRAKLLASTFEEWWCIKGFPEPTTMSVRQKIDEAREIAQKLFSVASVRDHWEKLSQYRGPYKDRGGVDPNKIVTLDLSQEQYVEIARRLLADNPNDHDVRFMGLRFPADSEEFSYAIDAWMTMKLKSHTFHWLYQEAIQEPTQRAKIAAAYEIALDERPSDCLEDRSAVRAISDLARKVGDEILADKTYAFMVRHAKLKEDYRWVAERSPEGSEVRARFSKLFSNRSKAVEDELRKQPFPPEALV